MQQTTILPTPRRSGMPAWQKDVIGLVVALVALAGIWLGTHQLAAPAPASQAAVAPISRRFADEAAYTPSASDYAGMGESYLVPGVAPRSNLR